MPICVYDIHPDGTATAPPDHALTGGGTYRWWHFDLNDPDLRPWLAQTLAEIPAGALLQSETRPRADSYGDGLMVNLRGINMNEGPADLMVSVRLWMTRDVIVTVRVRKVFALDEMRQQIAASDSPTSTAAFLTTLTGKLTGRIQDEVARLTALTDFLEADLEDTRTGIPEDLQSSRRSVIKLNRYLQPQERALQKLLQSDTDLIPVECALRLREWTNRTTLAVEDLHALQDRIVAVQSEHDQIISQRQASHSYRLSLAAGIFLPLGFLTGVFGVNLAGMPGTENPMAFVWLCLGMAGLGLILLLLLKMMRWL